MIKYVSQRILLVLTAFLSSAAIFGQITVSNTLSPQELVEQILVGSCVEVSNVTYNGQSNVAGGQPAVGSFTSTNSVLSLPQGLVLASGGVTQIPTGGMWSPGSEAGSDPDLAAIAQGVSSIYDKSILEFDFIPSGDTISFRYVFASTEYASFTCTQFNDAFGFFLSGPGINGPFTNNAVNLAVVPNTNIPIAVNTINSGSPTGSGTAATCALADPNWQANSQYFINNPNATDFMFNGFTVVLTASAAVVCGETYHIKLAIGDAGDSGLDSGVFIEGGSFSSVPFIPTLAPGPLIVGDTIMESCLPHSMEIVRTSCDQEVTEVVHLSYSGTATMGDDITPVFPDSLVFDPGVSSATIDFMAPLDADGLETFIINMQTLDCNNELTSTSFTFYIDQAPPLGIEGSNFIIDCDTEIELSAEPTGGYGDYEYDWSNGGNTPTIAVTPLETTTYTVIVTDECGETASSSYTVTITPPAPLTMNLIGPNTVMEGCESTQINLLRPLGTTGDILVTFTTSGMAENGDDFVLPSTVTIPDGNFNLLVPFDPLDDNLGEGQEGVMITGSYTDDCGRTVTASVNITIIDAPEIFLEGNEYFIECGLDSVLLSVEASGGYNNNLLITWDSEGSVTGSSAWIPVQTSASWLVTATDPCGRTETTTVNVVVDCEIIIPNVFTPNNDNINDLWEIEGIQYTTNMVRVFNRWGQVVYETRNYRNSWRASDVPDGTYFYEIVVDRHEKPYTGHVTILRN